MTVKIRYFAWVRERVGKPEETIDLPAGVATAGDLMAWLAGRGEEYAHAFENPKIIRVAINQTHVPSSTPIKSAAEIAFFPPMTGG
jgi:molybdopterin synthase sulfur carrier subunit